MILLTVMVTVRSLSVSNVLQELSRRRILQFMQAVKSAESGSGAALDPNPL